MVDTVTVPPFCGVTITVWFVVDVSDTGVVDIKVTGVDTDIELDVIVCPLDPTTVTVLPGVWLDIFTICPADGVIDIDFVWLDNVTV